MEQASTTSAASVCDEAASVENVSSPAILDFDNVDTSLINCLDKVSTAQPWSSITEEELHGVFQKKPNSDKYMIPSPQCKEPSNPTIESVFIAANKFKHDLEQENYADDESPSFTTSMINLIFDEKKRIEKDMEHDESGSLSLIDFDAVDVDGNLCAAKDEHLSILVKERSLGHVNNENSVCMKDADLAGGMSCASPIPFAAEMEPRVAKTPVESARQISSTFATSPFNDAHQSPFSVSSNLASPVKNEGVVASTPFHNRMVSQWYGKSTSAIDTTCDLETQEEQASINQNRTRHIDTTYDANLARNVTFSAVTSHLHTAINNATFNKPRDDESIIVTKSNETFEVIVKSIPDTALRAAEITPPNQNATFDASKGTTSPEVVESMDRKSEIRKPLTLLAKNQPDSRLKSGMSSLNSKRTSRLPAPRMNAAAISRMQARSPSKLCSGDAHDENSTVSSMKPPLASSSLRKPQTRKIPRKSLLPPPPSKQRALLLNANNPVSKKYSSCHTNSKNADLSTVTNNKRKADSPRHPAGHAAKIDGPRSDSSQVRSNVSSSSLRNNSAQSTPRSSSLSAKSSKLQRPQAARPVTSSLNKPSETSIARSRVSTRQTKASAAKRSQTASVNTKGNIRKPASRTSQCVVALGTLLDYVVNQLDGLSAPRLASDKEQLQHLVSEATQDKFDLTTRVDDLEKVLHLSRESHTRDVTQAKEHHERDVKELNERHETERNDLQERLEEISKELSVQQSQYEESIATLREETDRTITELIHKHEEIITQLQDKWSDEKEKMEIDTQELRDQMNSKIEAKVQELIQPYVNSYEENQSLRTVLEMKNSEHHKLKLEVSQQEEQLNEVRTLRDHVISLQQKNEDLQTQVREKNVEQRTLRNEITQLRRNLDEQQHVSSNQQQRIEELSYRLDCSSPVPSSPFNPVFTPSPTATDTSSGASSLGGSGTPIRTKHGRGFASQRSDNSKMMTSSLENSAS